MGKSCLVERAHKGYVRHDNPTIAPSFVVKTVTLPSSERIQLEIWDTGAHRLPPPRSSAVCVSSCFHLPHTTHLIHASTLSPCAAGQEKYKSVSRLYFRGARGCLLVYDVSNRQSFAAYLLPHSCAWVEMQRTVGLKVGGCVVVWLLVRRRWDSLEQWLEDFRTEIDPSCIPLIQVVAAKCDLAANAQQVRVASSRFTLLCCVAITKVLTMHRSCKPGFCRRSRSVVCSTERTSRPLPFNSCGGTYVAQSRIQTPISISRCSTGARAQRRAKV